MNNLPSVHTNLTDGLSLDIQQEKIDALKKLVPEVFSDGKIDAEKLKRVIGENNVAGDERYRLEWAGKSEVFDEIAKRSAGTLTLDEKRSSKNWKDSNNVFIEGENLAVLRTLQKAYYGKVKMIYIDPPYNTGKDFVYNDNFRATEEEYCDDICNVDENGNIKKALKINSRDSGRFHSNWLSMMYPRLFLARNLLRDDGVIFVSIDDNEVHNLRLIMNEIFGEENFIAQIIWQKKRGKDNSAKFLSTSHEYLVAFAKNIEHLKFQKLEMSEARKAVYSNPDNDPRGVYVLQPAWASGMKKGPKYEVSLGPHFFKERMWLYARENLLRMFDEGRLSIKGKHKDSLPNVYIKVYLTEIEGVLPDTIWQDAQNTGDAVTQVKDLFDGQIYFDTPKPYGYVKKMLSIATSDSDVILDFFSGSGTTAHAIMAQNAEDGGNRQYICVQIPEETPEGSEARKAGYKRISDIAIDRIKKAATKIRDEYPEFKGDLGVRVYMESDSYFPQWHARAFESNDALKQAVIDYNKEKVTGTTYDRTTELLIKLGYPLTTSLEEKNGCFVTSDGVVFALDSVFTVENLKKVLTEKPKTIVALEKIFKKDEDKINFGLRCKEAGVIFQTV